MSTRKKGSPNRRASIYLNVVADSDELICQRVYLFRPVHLIGNRILAFMNWISIYYDTCGGGIYVNDGSDTDGT